MIKHRRFDGSRVNAFYLAKAVNYFSCIEIIVPCELSPFYMDSKRVNWTGVILGIDNSNSNNVIVEFQHFRSQKKDVVELKMINRFTTFFNTPSDILMSF